MNLRLPAGWRALVAHEMRQLLAASQACVFVVIYLLISLLAAFFIGDLLLRDHASLEALFRFQPWVLLALAPALSMRAWSDEFSAGTAERLLTLPVAPAAAVLAKYLAHWAVIAVAVFSTMTLWITIALLGNPDHGQILAGYITTLLLAAVYLAVGHAVSARCATATSAYAVTVAVLALFMMLGSLTPLLLARAGAPAMLTDGAARFSLLDVSSLMVRGALPLSTILLLAAMILLALGLAIRAINARRRIITPLRWPMVSAITVALLGTTFLPGAARLDLTSERLFTLSAASRQVLSTLTTDVHVNLVVSRAAIAPYPLLRNYADRAADLLHAYRAASHGRLRFTLTDAETPDDVPQARGIDPLVSAEAPDGRTILLGAVLTSGAQPAVRIPFLPDEPDSVLEYRFTREIARLAHLHRPIIGILSSLPLATGPGGALGALRGDSRPMALFDDLRRHFDIRLLAPGNLQLASVDVLLLLAPPKLQVDDVRTLDAFMMGGGRLVIAVDPWPELGETLHTASSADAEALDPLLHAWGVSWRTDAAVADPVHAQHVPMSGADGRMVRVPSWVALTDDAISRTSPITQSLQRVNLFSSGSWALHLPHALQAETLLATAPEAGLIPVAALRARPDPALVAAHIVPEKRPLPVAVQISGLFPSAFEGRAAVTGSAVLIADTDWLQDVAWRRTAPLFGTALRMDSADNSLFIINAVDSLLGQSSLIALRSKGRTRRPLDRLAQLRANYPFADALMIGVNLAGMPLLLSGAMMLRLAGRRRRSMPA